MDRRRARRRRHGAAAENRNPFPSQTAKSSSIQRDFGRAVPRFTRELSRSLFARTRVYSYAAIEATRDSLWPYRGVRLRRSVAKSEVNHDGEVAPRSVDMEIFDVISPTD